MPKRRRNASIQLRHQKSYLIQISSSTIHGRVVETQNKKTTFVLCVSNFSIRYHIQNDLDHLLNALRTTYEIFTNSTGGSYIVLTIEWEYVKGYIDISMPKYILKEIQKNIYSPPNR